MAKFTEKYTNSDKSSANPAKESGKTLISNESYAICELLSEIENSLKIMRRFK